MDVAAQHAAGTVYLVHITTRWLKQEYYNNYYYGYLTHRGTPLKGASNDSLGHSLHNSQISYIFYGHMTSQWFQGSSNRMRLVACSGVPILTSHQVLNPTFVTGPVESNFKISSFRFYL